MTFPLSRRRSALHATVACLVCVFLSTRGGATTLAHSVVASAGTSNATSANHSVAFTLGQGITGTGSGPHASVTSGFWHEVAAATDIAAPPGTTPKLTRLHQNYPNPFNPVTYIRFDIGSMETGPVHTTIKIFAVDGRFVRSLADAPFAPGEYAISWNGTDYSGVRVSTGIYYCQLASGPHRESIRLVLLK